LNEPLNLKEVKMGLLVEGKWHTDWYETAARDGEFIRADAQYRQRIGDQQYPAEAGRYHLFVSLACPWAHRTLIFRKLKNLESIIGVTVVKPKMLDNGWEISSQVSLAAGYDASPVSGISTLHQLYSIANADFSGRVTVPVLWDRESQTIVNNESSEIIRMLNTSFNGLTHVETDYYPAVHRQEIDELNSEIYRDVNNGVYRAGFATSQQAYDSAFERLFHLLDQLETRLGKKRYLVGDDITEADWRLFTTLIRFDKVYFGHFKTNLRQIEDYPSLSNYVRDLYQQPGIADTVDFDHIKTHYYFSHDMINPTRIIPAGPEIDYSRPHNRQKLATMA
jgi:glutathionyl-hydroquinone reductase